MKCRKCGGKAVLELRRHNAAFCAEDFLAFFRSQTLETIRRWKMVSREEPLLVAVSGGKDSLALWDVLHGAGYRTTGLYLDLGIFEYSQASKARCEAFAAERGLELRIVAVADEVGAAIPAVRDVTRRPTCSACGLSKRYIMNRAAMEGGFPVVIHSTAGRALGLDPGWSFYIATVPLVFLVARLPVSLGGLGFLELSFVSLAGLLGVSWTDAFAIAGLATALYLVALIPGAVLYLIPAAAPVRPAPRERLP